ncbi:MAG: antitoxin family protein [Planctomycetales bacterium]
MKTVEAVYERGVLRPLEQLDLQEHARVEITIRETVRASIHENGSCYDLALKAGIIGCLTAAPADLSSNSDHMAEFGAA